MTESTTFDPAKAHAYFSADCFNRAWDHIDQTARTADDDLDMLLLTLSSLWHWTQRTDKTDQTLSVGYWQAARVFALIGQADNARVFGQRALSAGAVAGPFYVGYAYEALARAELVGGNPSGAANYVVKAREQMALIEDAEERELLASDLATIVTPAE